MVIIPKCRLYIPLRPKLRKHYKCSIREYRYQRHVVGWYVKRIFLVVKKKIVKIKIPEPLGTAI